MPARRFVASATLAVLSAHASLASAQTIDAATKATARQLGEDGMKAFDQGDCATASEKLWRAHDLVHVPTLAFYAGKCLEKLGRLVDAEEKYLEATRDPVDANAPPAVQAAQADAAKAREALLPRIPSVILSVRPPLPDAVVTLDGKPVPQAMIGVKRPIDPGSHDAAVQRGPAVAHRPFVVAEGDSVSVDLPIPAYPYPYGYPAPRPGYAVYPPGPVVVAGPPPVPTERRSLPLLVTGAIVAPVGGVLIIAGLASTLDTKNSTPGYVIAGVGVAALTGGIIMAAIGGKKVPVTPAPAPGPAPVSMEPFFGPTSGVRLRF